MVKLGFCITVVHNLVASLNSESENIDLEGVYDSCNVPIQETCKNNPLRGSGSLPQALTFSVAGALWALLIQTIVIT